MPGKDPGIDYLRITGNIMGLFFQIHPDNPQARLILRSVSIIRNGGVMAYPTDSGYALGCHIGDKDALGRMVEIRRLSQNHNFTLICRDMKDISVYSVFDTPEFRLIRANTPGPYTFILHASRELPRRLKHYKRKTIGIRIPGHIIVQEILKELGEPLLSTTLIMPGDDMPLNDAHDIYDSLRNRLDLVIDGGPCGTIPTTVVDLTVHPPAILRKGKGDPAPFYL